MKPRDILHGMTGIQDGTVMTLAPGPIEVKCGLQDARAAELLLWILERWPELKMRETMSTLHSAIWWLIFFSSNPSVEE